MKHVLTAAALAAAGFTGAAQADGLIGDQVGVKLSITGFPAFLCANCDTSFAVGAGSEGAIYNNTQAIDFGAYSFDITSKGSFTQFGFNPVPADRPVTLLLSSLNFGTPLADVTFTTTLNGPVTRTFGSDFVQFTFFDQAVSQGQKYISAQFITAAVPEPETYALMLMGLVGIGFIANRRRRND